MKQSSQSGLAIVELLLALAIATLSFGGLFVMLGTATRIMENNRRDLDATLLAESVIEGLKASGWTDVTNKPSRYEVDADTHVDPHATGTSAAFVEIVVCPGFEPALAPRRVTVKVTWAERNGHARTNGLTTTIGPWSRKP
jgi:hypothetical protein